MAQNSHISDHLMVAKLGAIAAGDLVLVYLIDMAIPRNWQNARCKGLFPTSGVKA